MPASRAREARNIPEHHDQAKAGVQLASNGAAERTNLPDHWHQGSCFGFQHQFNKGYLPTGPARCSALGSRSKSNGDRPPESSLVCCKSLISLYILLPNLSSTCHEAESARLRGTSQPTFSQTYPQILWVAQVSHNCRDLYPRGDSICFQSYKLQAGRSGH